MAPKKFPRSLRSSQLLSHDFSFFAEKNYSSLWAKTYQVTNTLLNFGEKNLLAKSKTKSGPNQRYGKKKKWETFLKVRAHGIVHGLGNLHCSPIFFKFSQGSLHKKYNPLKTATKAKSFQKKILKKLYQPRNLSRSFFSFIVP